MLKESRELIHNKPSNFVIFSNLDKSTKPLCRYVQYPIFERADKTDHSSGIIRISIMVNLSGENFPSSLAVNVWENTEVRVRYFARHTWEIEGDKGKFTRLGFSSDGQEPTRKMCEGVYFNEDLTELHFPEGIVKLREVLVK